MTSFRVRPKFKISCKKSIVSIILLFTDSLKNTSLPIEGKVFKSHGLIMVNPSALHYWSPQLNISFEESDYKKTIIRGRYGPSPSVWAMFLLGYAVLTIGLFFFTIVGLVRLSLNLDATILWVIPFIVGGLIGLWLVAQAGQKVGVKQTFMIHHFFEETIGMHIHIV